jgi:hypothetical protein
MCRSKWQSHGKDRRGASASPPGSWRLTSDGTNDRLRIPLRILARVAWPEPVVDLEPGLQRESPLPPRLTSRLVPCVRRQSPASARSADDPDGPLPTAGLLPAVPHRPLAADARRRDRRGARPAPRRGHRPPPAGGRARALGRAAQAAPLADGIAPVRPRPPPPTREADS